MTVHTLAVVLYTASCRCGRDFDAYTESEALEGLARHLAAEEGANDE